MLDTLRRLFGPSPDTTSAISEHQLHLAAAVLLIEVGRADFALDDQEMGAVISALKKSLDLTDRESAHLVTLAREQSREAHSLHPFLRQINERFDPQQKADLLQNLWHVAYADDRLHKYEEYQIRRIADLLYLPHSTFIRTKHNARKAARSSEKDPGKTPD